LWTSSARPRWRATLLRGTCPRTASRSTPRGHRGDASPAARRRAAPSHDGLDRGDVLADRSIVLVLVDQPRRAQYEQPKLFDLDPAVGDALLGDLHRRERTVTRLPRHRPLAHQVECLSQLGNSAHCVVDPATARRACAIAKAALPSRAGERHRLVRRDSADTRACCGSLVAPVPTLRTISSPGESAGTMNIDIPS